jgi:spermidine synthase
MMRTVLLALGFFMIVAQVLLMRQLAVVFHGTEIYLAATLASWLLLTGVGSLTAGWFADRAKKPGRVFAMAFCGAGVLLPATMLAARVGPQLFLRVPGQVVPYWQMALMTLALLAPLCLLLGFLFTLACRMIAGPSQVGPLPISRAYLTEAFGTVIGGLLLTFLLLNLLSPLQIACGAGLLAATVSLIVWVGIREETGAWGVWLVPVWLGLLVLTMPPLSPALDFLSVKLMIPPGYSLRESESSRYGQIDVAQAQRGRQCVFYSDGMPVGTNEDAALAEEVAHFPLLTHPKPRQVLVVGGGPSGVVTRVLDHPTVEHVDYVELDPALVSCALRYAATRDRQALQSEKVTIHGDVDGRRFIKEVRRQYDVIIVNQPDPMTAYINRFYTLEFFREVRACLTPDGIFAIGVSTSPGYMTRELRVLTASIFETVGQVFPGIAIIATDLRNYILASPNPEATALPSQVLAQRMADRGIKPVWLNAPTLTYLASEQRRADVFAAIQPELSKVALNSDLRPITYYYALLFRNRLFAPGEEEPFIEGFNLIHVIAGAVMLVAILVAAGMFTSSPRRVSVPALLFVAGLAGIVLEMVLVFVFQSFYGYAYYYLGAIFAGFMLGLALGAMGGADLVRTGRAGGGWLCGAVAGLAVYAIVLPSFFGWMSSSGLGDDGIVAQVVFPALTAVAGGLLGLIFPLSVEVYGVSAGEIGKRAGILYGADLLGSCVGALAVGALFVPVLGLRETCYAVAILLLAGALQFIISEPGD